MNTEYDAFTYETKEEDNKNICQGQETSASETASTVRDDSTNSTDQL